MHELKQQNVYTLNPFVRSKKEKGKVLEFHPEVYKMFNSYLFPSDFKRKESRFSSNDEDHRYQTQNHQFCAKEKIHKSTTRNEQEKVVVRTGHLEKVPL